jgi:hypothetical protein
MPRCGNCQPALVDCTRKQKKPYRAPQAAPGNNPIRAQEVRRPVQLRCRLAQSQPCDQCLLGAAAQRRKLLLGVQALAEVEGAGG